jgi:outer membrane protein assembly factor BamB
LTTVGGRRLVVFCGGDGVVYAFEALDEAVLGREGAAGAPPLSLRKVWWFDTDPAAPKEEVHRYHLNKQEGPSNVFGMPVCLNDRVYVAGGGDLWWGKNEAWLQCILVTGSGNVTQTHRVWSYPLERHVMATPAVADGLVYITDCGHFVHCVDATTGQRVWAHDAGGEMWASPLVADGKVYVGTRRGDFWVLAAGREKQVLSSFDSGSPISATAVAANGTLYVTTMNRLFAVANRTDAATQ